MKITVEEGICIIEQEILWCLDNPDSKMSPLEQLAFIGGLRQAIYLLSHAKNAKEKIQPCLRTRPQ
jgi:hypothetical protein